MKSVLLVILCHLVLGGTGFAFAQTERESSGHYQFVENKGQWPNHVGFRATLENGWLYAESNALTFDFWDPRDVKDFVDRHHSKTAVTTAPSPIRGHSYTVRFLDSASAFPYGDQPLQGTYNYFLGDDPSKWGHQCQAFSGVKWENLYPGIHLDLYSKDFLLKYDFIVEPGANPSTIQLSYEAVNRLQLRNGRLIITTSVNEVIEQRPIAFQWINGQKVLVPCEFVLNGNQLSFELPESYDQSLPLIIDPELIFSSYTGSFSNNFGYTATYDDDGYLYSGSSAFGAQYPVTPGAYEISFQNGLVDIALSKWDVTGTFLVYSTYLGGSSDELPHSLIVNSSGELFVYGTTSSLNFPTTSGAYDTAFNGGSGLNLLNGLGVNYTNGADIIVSRLSADGSDLLASTYIGGSGNDGLNAGTPLKFNYADEIRGEILIDAQNNIYIASSSNSSDFPVSAGSFGPVYQGGAQDGVIFKMDNGLSTLLWSAYLGGSSDDAVYAVDLDSQGNAIVCGGTSSVDFPITFGSIQQSFGGGTADGFITRIAPDGDQIIQSTYWGSGSYDQIYFVELDEDDQIHVFGQTQTSGGFFIINAAYGVPSSGQFVSKFDPNMDAVVWSTAFGTGSGQPNISPTAFLVDVCNKVYLSGWGSSIQGGPLSTTGLPVTPGAFQTTTTGGDFYMMVLEDDASAIFYASYFGGNQSTEHVDGGTSRFDRKGIIYQAVCAGCGGNDDFPILPNPGAVSAQNNSSCNLGVFKFDFQLPLTVADFSAPPAICNDEAINFVNQSVGGNSYFWSFGDGTSSEEFSPSHTYAEPGVYDVMLVVTDPATCNGVDTLFNQVLVLNNSSSQLQSIDMCAGETVQIGIPPSSDPGLSYEWVPSDGLSDPGASNPFVTTNSSVDYVLLVSNGVCTDSLYQSVQVTQVGLESPEDLVLCEPGSLVELSASANSGATYIWSLSPDFSDPLNATPEDPSVSLNPESDLVVYIQASLDGCTESDAVTIIFTATQTEIGGDFIACPGDTVSLNVLSPSPDLTYTWSPEALILTGQNTSSVTVSPQQTTTYLIESSNSEGCTVVDSVTVTVSTLTGGAIQAYADPTVVAEGGTSQLQAEPQGFSYIWTPQEGLNNPFIPNPTATPEQTTTYYVSIADGECVYIDSVTVRVADFICGDPSIYVPNAFTPNGDNQNEMLFVRGNNLTRIKLVIYNRWGEKVFETQRQDQGWDATYKGMPVDPAVFVYYLEAVCADGQEYFEKGNITVIR